MDNQGYLKEFLDTLKGQLSALFEKYNELSAWRREHEIECERRYSELKALLTSVNEKIDRRNAERDKREAEAAKQQAKMPPANAPSPPGGIIGRVLRFIGEKPSMFIIMLLIALLFIEAAARLPDGLLPALFGGEVMFQLKR